MKSSLRVLAISLLVVLVGCSDDTTPSGDGPVLDMTAHDLAQPDGSVPDGAVPDGAVPDGAVPDGPVTDTMQGEGIISDLPPPDMPSAPAAPTVTKPAANDKVFAVVDIQGTGAAGATVEARLMLGTTELAKGAGAVDTQGSFALTLQYSGASHNDALSLEVWLTNSAGASPTTTVALVHDAPHTVGGNISQTGGPNSGTAVFVRLYDSDLDKEIINHIAEVQLTATAGQFLASTPFSFNVPDGTYYLRAFRDSAGPHGPTPDGHPSLGSDAQAPSRKVVVSGGNMANEDLVLKDRTNTDHYWYNAQTSHESSVPKPPEKWVGPTKTVGKGLCGGFLMRLSAFAQGSQLSQPMVRLPDGTIVTMLDDGGCGDAVIDNTASSYDHQANDGSFNYGIQDPSVEYAGTYTFFHAQTADDFIHIEEDEVASIVKLPMLRELTAPDGTATVNTLKPAVSWKAVPGAAYYEIDIGQMGGSYSNSNDPGRRLTGTTYTPAADLNDDDCYDVKIGVHDADPTKDVDASAFHSDSHRFCVDQDGANSITVSGAVTNKTGKNNAIMIRVRSNTSNHWATTRVAAGATTYQVGLLAGTAVEGGIQAYLDVAGTGDRYSPENQPYMIGKEQIDLQQSATVDLTFTSPVLVTAPANGATASSLTPAFSWQDYAQTSGPSKPSGAFIYAIHIGEGGFPATLYALPPSATSLDMSNLPTGNGYFDLVQMATCLQGGGAFSFDAAGKPQCTGATMQASANPLKAATTYSWGVVVVECDWSTYQPPAPSTAFLTCIGNALGGINYASSETRQLTTP